MSSETRLNKYLSDSGICSRREADKLIESGKVTVDGKTAVLGQKINPGQIVMYDGKSVVPDDNMIILAFNKPEGIECTTSEKVKNNIVKYIDYPSRIFPVGRLDKNSTGLILLTNTGEISDRILRGSNFHEKEYEVKTDKAITADFIEQMSSGVRIYLDDGKREVITRPCRAEQVSEKVFRIILTQGLNRQIRRMCAALGYSVVSLKRVRIMNIRLGNLKTGQYRHLRTDEIDKLLRKLG